MITTPIVSGKPGQAPPGLALISSDVSGLAHVVIALGQEAPVGHTPMQFAAVTHAGSGSVTSNSLAIMASKPRPAIANVF